DKRFQTARISAAKIFGETMISLDKTDLNLDVVSRRRESRQHELDIDALFVHVANARFSVVIGTTGSGKAGAHKFREMPLAFRSRSRFAQDPQLLSPAGAGLEAVTVTIRRFENLAGPA